MMPPYDLSLRVEALEGRTIALTVACRDGRYVATNVTAAPPGGE